MQTGSPCAFLRQRVVVLVWQLAQIIPVLLFPVPELETLILAEGGLLTVAPVLGLIPFILL